MGIPLSLWGLVVALKGVAKPCLQDDNPLQCRPRASHVTFTIHYRPINSCRGNNYRHSNGCRYSKKRYCGYYQKYCFIYNKEGCWSLNHTFKEYQKVYKQYLLICKIKGHLMFDVKFASFLADFEGINIVLEDIYNKYKDNLNGYEKA